MEINILEIGKAIILKEMPDKKNMKEILKLMHYMNIDIILG